MKIRWVACVATVLVLAGCSSSPPDYTPPAGELVAGTAQVTVNGRDAGVTQAVQCNTTEWLTTITTGDQTSGITAMLSNKDELVTESVSINNVGGFTGSYTADVGGTGGAAQVGMTGNTYDISGTADGFNTDAPSFRVPGTFAIRVAC
ncbi:lipoprotein antigen [Mycolicibacterium rutilum]|uniref:Lipoprotein antigen n=1 Tax=Mycolicibacterium rutilum TaxID=370526 RepID=A0A1H6JAV1_MYCRU|nr:lipoprotein LpqH [Mycolicibacterium rutilum]SEH59248.1 lipoprotein antigen [Mycolicibacterium rutilum]